VEEIQSYEETEQKVLLYAVQCSLFCTVVTNISLLLTAEISAKNSMNKQ